jgi:hydrogenase maturation factor
MCLATFLQVIKIHSGKAVMSDGRVISLSNIENVKIGDYLEVYADLAIRIVAEKEVKIINNARQK